VGGSFFFESSLGASAARATVREAAAIAGSSIFTIVMASSHNSTVEPNK
jgi:hypothetical protein